MTHDLVKNSDGLFQCRVCQQIWKSRSRTRCPQIRVYPKNDYGLLRTQTQLGYEDYDTSQDRLPAPVGCFQTSPGGAYILLYDPTQAIKRETPRRRRTTTSITAIAWPLSCISILSSYDVLVKIRSYNHTAEDRACQRLEQDIIRIAACLQAFSRDEITAMGSGILDLNMPPTLVRRAYPRRESNQNEQTTLLSRIMTAYRNSKSTQKATREN